MAPEGTDILRVPIARRYPTDDVSHYTSNDMCRYVYKYVKCRYCQSKSENLLDLLTLWYRGLVTYRTWLLDIMRVLSDGF